MNLVKEKARAAKLTKGLHNPRRGRDSSSTRGTLLHDSEFYVTILSRGWILVARARVSRTRDLLLRRKEREENRNRDENVLKFSLSCYRRASEIPLFAAMLRCRRVSRAEERTWRATVPGNNVIQTSNDSLTLYGP